MKFAMETLFMDPSHVYGIHVITSFDEWAKLNKRDLPIYENSPLKVIYSFI